MRRGRRGWRGFLLCGAVPIRAWEPAWGWGPSAYPAWDVGSAGRRARRAEGPGVRGGAAWRGHSVRGRRVGWGPRAGVSVGWEPLPRLHGAALVCGVRAPVRRSACMAAGCAPLGAGARAVVRGRGPPGVARTSAVWCGFAPCRVVILWRTYAGGWGLGACGGPCGWLPSGSACAEGPCACCGILRLVRISAERWGFACAGPRACRGGLRVLRALRVWCGSPRVVRTSALMPLSACGAGLPPDRRSSGGARPGGVGPRTARRQASVPTPSSRATSIRWTSLVPSPISRIFASRHMRATGYSFMKP
ncbi:hypothetical protein SUDANB19_02491 [Streptomyces sp. enrichment culture]